MKQFIYVERVKGTLKGYSKGLVYFGNINLRNLF